MHVLPWKYSVIDGVAQMPSVKHLSCQLYALQPICCRRQCASLLMGSSSCITDGSELGKLKKGKAVARAQLVWCLWPSLSMPFLFKTYTETRYLQCGQLFLEFLLPPAPVRHHCLGTSWYPPSSYALPKRFAGLKATSKLVSATLSDCKTCSVSAQFFKCQADPTLPAEGMPWR